jgi:hypothetical protein
MDYADWICLNPKCRRKSIEPIAGEGVRRCRYCGGGLQLACQPAPAAPAGRMFCPICHKRFPAAEAGSATGLRCPNCHAPLRETATETAVVHRAWPARLRRRKERAVRFLIEEWNGLPTATARALHSGRPVVWNLLRAWGYTLLAALLLFAGLLTLLIATGLFAVLVRHIGLAPAVLIVGMPILIVLLLKIHQAILALRDQDAQGRGG